MGNQLSGIEGSSDVLTGLITMTVGTLEGDCRFTFPIDESWKFIGQIAKCHPKRADDTQVGPIIPVQQIGLLEASANSPILLVVTLPNGGRLRIAIPTEAATPLAQDLSVLAAKAKDTPRAKTN